MRQNVMNQNDNVNLHSPSNGMGHSMQTAPQSERATVLANVRMGGKGKNGAVQGIAQWLRAGLITGAVLLGLFGVNAAAMAAATVSLSAGSLDFGAQAMNSRSAIQTVTVSNTGDAVLNIASLTLGAPNPAQFAIASSGTCKAGSNIVAGGNCTVDLQFAPTLNQAAGIKSTTLILTDNGQNGSQSIGITGTTIAAAATTATLSAASLNFTSQPLVSSATQSITVNNTGSQPLNIYSGAVTLSGSSRGQYTLLSSSTCLSANGVSVAVGGSCTLDVQYTPSSTAVIGTTYSASLNLALNTADTPLSVALTGELSTIVQAYYIHADQLDTPRQITDTAGNVVWQWDNSDPFGNNSPNENPTGQGTFSFPLRFAGQYADSYWIKCVWYYSCRKKW